MGGVLAGKFGGVSAVLGGDYAEIIEVAVYKTLYYGDNRNKSVRPRNRVVNEYYFPLGIDEFSIILNSFEKIAKNIEAIDKMNNFDTL